MSILKVLEGKQFMYSVIRQLVRPVYSEIRNRDRKRTKPNPNRTGTEKVRFVSVFDWEPYVLAFY